MALYGTIVPHSVVAEIVNSGPAVAGGIGEGQLGAAPVVGALGGVGQLEGELLALVAPVSMGDASLWSNY